MPPETRSKPRSISAAASALRVGDDLVRVRPERPAAPPRAARPRSPAVVWLCGPPCRPGNTALSIALACSAVVMIMAPRGPRSVLCVVVVIDVGVADRRRVRAAGDQAGDVRDVGDEDRADLAGDRGEAGEVDRARDRRAAAEDELGALGQRQVAHLVEVDAAGLAATRRTAPG